MSADAVSLLYLIFAELFKAYPPENGFCGILPRNSINAHFALAKTGDFL